jgi:glutamine cyclotransferase
MDLSPLLEQLPLEARMKAQNDPDATPNGIAYDPATSSLYLTVKNWPLFFQVVLPK